MTPHNVAVTIGHGDNTASIDTKKMAPTYHAKLDQSDTSTKRSHLGIGEPLRISPKIGWSLACRRKKPFVGEPARLPPLTTQTEHGQTVS